VNPAPQGPPRAILFDWDNTLVDNWSVIAGSMNAVFEAFDMPQWTLAETKARTRASLRDSFPRMFGERATEAGRIFSEHFASRHLAELREMPGAGALLKRLKKSGLYLGIVSNKRGRFLRLEADHLGWTGHFTKLVGAADAPEDKPAIAPVELALAGSGIPRGGDVWFVGDADIDIDCAVNAGCVPVLLRAEAPAMDEFAVNKPHLHFSDCNALARRLAEAGVLPSPNL
jgi:phosphoglycolate phosphatase